jgi:shikimate dehydrogenase
MWNEALPLIGVDAVYTVLSFNSDEDVEVALGALIAEPSYLGGNVTQPFKEVAYRTLKEVGSVDEFAEEAEAVNTIVHKDGELTGYNTDGKGEIRNLETVAPNLSGMSVLVLGAGGAARGVIPALLDSQIGKLVIANRTVSSADYIADRMRSFYPEAVIKTAGEDKVGSLATSGKFDLILNTTTKGQNASELSGYSSLVSTNMPISENLTASRSIISSIAEKNPKTICADLIYNPSRSPFLAQAEAAGLPVLNGKMMLVHQAALAFELIFGHQVAYNRVVTTMERAFDRRISPA